LDACSLVGALSRNTLLSLAEAELYRPRWSREILDETTQAIGGILAKHGEDSSKEKALRHVEKIETSFPEGAVEDFDELQNSLQGYLSDPRDTHVLAAALKCRASVIVTENIKHFLEDVLASLNLEALTPDNFIANTIDLSQQKAIAAIAQMRGRFSRPELSGNDLLLTYEKRGFLQTADILRVHVMNL
jgi:predicted nucleic acid-binding protein